MSFLSLYDRYVLKNLVPTTIFTAITLAAIILLTQSLKFLELIIESGASSASFWILTFLALPRFFEIILPIALMISTVFTYYRMSSDSEVVVMKAAGKSPMGLARPALTLSLIITMLLIFITTWLAPVALNNMVKMRQVIKAQYSAALFREGIFNPLGKDLMIYIANRSKNGEMEGLLIHDSRAANPQPVTIIAKRGVIVSTNTGQQVLVYDGSRQDFNPKTGALNRLNFDRYTIDLPESGAVISRNKDPDERTFWQLFHPDLTNEYDVIHQKEFIVEAHKRIISPFLTIGFVGIALCFLLIGPINRRGQAKRIFYTIILVMGLQGLYLGLFNIAKDNLLGLVSMYIVVCVPIGMTLFLLSPYAEKLRYLMLYSQKSKNKTEEEAI